MMARKEEEKKRESNRTNIMKVRNDLLLFLFMSFCNYTELVPSVCSRSVFYTEEERLNACISTVATHSMVT